MRRVLVLAQSAPGGELQMTPAQGSGLQVPLAQPNAQVASDEVYEQVPLPQVPEVEYVRRTVALAQMGEGGVLQANVCWP